MDPTLKDFKKWLIFKLRNIVLLKATFVKHGIYSIHLNKIRCFLNYDIFLTHGPDEISAAIFFKIITGTTELLTAPIPARWGRGS